MFGGDGGAGAIRRSGGRGVECQNPTGFVPRLSPRGRPGAAAKAPHGSIREH